MNSAGNKKPEAAALLMTAWPVLASTMALPAASTAALDAKKPVNAGMSMLDAAPMTPAPTMPITASAIMPYSR